MLITSRYFNLMVAAPIIFHYLSPELLGEWFCIQNNMCVWKINKFISITLDKIAQRKIQSIKFILRNSCRLVVEYYLVRNEKCILDVSYRPLSRQRSICTNYSDRIFDIRNGQQHQHCAHKYKNNYSLTY